MAKFAITLTNRQVLTVTAPTEIKARQVVEQEITDRGSKLRITGVRLITGTVR